MRVFVTLLLAFAPALADESKPKEREKRAGDVEIPDPGTPIEDSSVASQEVARFQKDFKAAKTQEEKIKAIERIGKWDHPKVVKALSRPMKDRDHMVARAAVVALARQASSQDKAGSAMLGALKREKRTYVVCALLVGMGKLGYDKKQAIKMAEKHFRRDTKEGHKAATRYFGYIKHKPAFRMLAEKLDEPRPKNPNDPANPPASYWKERWYEWEANVPYTRWAISELVEGETFDNLEEAKQWAEAHGKDHGIEW